MRDPSNVKIYLAASFPRQEEARTIAARINSMPRFTVTSGWLEDKGGYSAIDSVLNRRAARDRLEIAECDIFVQLIGDNGSSGGRHAELGLAMGFYKLVILVGPTNLYEHILQRDLSIWRCENLAHLEEALKVI